MLKNKMILSSNGTKIFLTEKSIVNKELANEIRSSIEEDFEIAINLESIIDPEIRENLVMHAFNLLHEVKSYGLIEQWSVISDKRNNTKEDLKQGVVYFMVSFRQKNCLNTSILDYKIVREPKIIKKNIKNSPKPKKRVIF